jgi:hypothetical protein
MEFLIGAIAKHVSLHTTEEELKEKLKNSETLMQFKCKFYWLRLWQELTRIG